MTSVNEPLSGGPFPGAPVQNAAFLAAHYGPAYRWLVTITGMVGVVSMVLAMTTVNVAVPDVMGAFGIGQDKAQWMSSAYMATMTAGMLLNAWMSGVLGERRTFIGALFFFSLGAVLGGMAPNEDMLIFARILQGFSAGIAQPLVMATIFTVFPAERRGSAMGIFGLGVVFAPAIGPTLGGLMIEYFSWRYVFYISLPFCGIAAIMGAFFMPTRPLAREIPPFDWLGFALLCVGLWGLMTGIADGQREGWSSDVIVLRLVLGASAAVGFVLWELRVSQPLLEIRIFANPQFAAAERRPAGRLALLGGSRRHSLPPGTGRLRGRFRRGERQEVLPDQAQAHADPDRAACLQGLPGLALPRRSRRPHRPR